MLEPFFPIQAFSCEYCETFKNTYIEQYLRMAASGVNLKEINSLNAIKSLNLLNAKVAIV